MTGVLLNGARVDLCLDLSHLGLELDEPGVVVVVSLNFCLQSPIAVLTYLVDDVGVVSPARDKDSESRVRALSRGCDAMTSPTCREEREEERGGSTFEVRLQGAEWNRILSLKT